MKFVDHGKKWVDERSQRMTSWIAEREDGDGAVGLGTKLYARDRDAFASVLGSAIALRLFLFVVPANIAFLGLANLLNLDRLLGKAMEASPTTGAMAQNYHDLSTLRALWITLTGLVLVLWTGRTLARTLGACSAAAWQMDARASRFGTRSVLALSGLFFALLLATFTFSSLGKSAGVPVSFALWVGVVATFAAGWFLVQFSLPRATSDPGALLPGAALVGVGFAVLQWFMQIYLPARIERTSDTLGSLSVTVSSLGYFFLIGRLMSASFVLNAIVFERWGSISRFVFDLPGLRRLPVRYVWLRTFLDLPDKSEHP